MNRYSRRVDPSLSHPLHISHTRAFFPSIHSQIDYLLAKYGMEPAPKDPLPVTQDGTSRAEQAGRVYSGFTVAVQVTRNASFYIINMVREYDPRIAPPTSPADTHAQIMPILLLNFISLLTFLLHPAKLESRMALNVTCFLSLTAIKFVVLQDRPKSSYPVSPHNASACLPSSITNPSPIHPTTQPPHTPTDNRDRHQSAKLF